MIQYTLPLILLLLWAVLASAEGRVQIRWQQPESPVEVTHYAIWKAPPLTPRRWSRVAFVVGWRRSWSDPAVQPGEQWHYAVQSLAVNGAASILIPTRGAIAIGGVP